MLSRPSARRKTDHKQIELNLVPILDSLVTLICFLMLTMSFFNVVSIESPFPQASPESVKEQLKEKPLQLTISFGERDLEIWSPFNKIASKKIPYVEEAKPDTKALHEALVEIKKQFPKENKVVLVPTKKTDYDTLVTLMDAVRTLTPSDPPVYVPNPETRVDEVTKFLFPEVVFGNLLGES